MNKYISILSVMAGIFLAIYFAGYLMFYTGIKDILTNCSVVDNKLVLNEAYLIFGGLKIIFSSFVFTFILTMSARVSNTLWETNEE